MVDKSNDAGCKLPLPFEKISVYKENVSINTCSFVICAMLTPDEKYYHYAGCLADSCERYSLPYRIYEISSVHRSISLNGTDDLASTKANFIAFNMEMFPKKNILYVDVDVLFVDYPEYLIELSEAQYDFAIYNWLSDEHNEAYIPLTNGEEIQSTDTYQYYRYSHQIGYFSTEQLFCSGGVQFYRNSSHAKQLLERWQRVIELNPRSKDDECLDFAYNNWEFDVMHMKSVWLEKSYLRMPWWPHIKPIILHQEIPLMKERIPVKETDNQKRFYREKCYIKPNMLYFPSDYVIDTKNRQLFKYDSSHVVDVQHIPHKFWIYPEYG